MMRENVIENLTSKNDTFSCAYAEKILAESQETDQWYDYFADFALLLNHPKSLVRNRALHILAPMPSGMKKTGLMPFCQTISAI